jgi:hypothetical protein
MDDESVPRFVAMVAILIDGSWLHRAAASTKISSAEAIDLIKTQVEYALGSAKMGEMKRIK